MMEHWKYDLYKQEEKDEAYLASLPVEDRYPNNLFGDFEVNRGD